MESLKEIDENIRRAIDDTGCEIIMVNGDDYIPSFAYTIGLYEQFSHPEIICFGLSMEVMHMLLNQIKDHIEEEQKIFEVGNNYEGFLTKGFPITFLEVNKAFYNEYLGAAVRFYGSSDFPCLELIWPDKSKKYPWQQGFNTEFRFIQPLLDRDTDFFFYESKDLAIFTTLSVLNKENIIKFVEHDDDGDWFFLEDEEIDEETIITASLKQIVEVDPGINDIYYLNYGTQAKRKSADTEWEIEN